MNSSGLVVLPGEGLVWQMEPDRSATFRLLSEQTGNSVAIFEELIPAAFGTALHLHHTSDEAMCVLGGEFSFKIGDSITRGGVGTWAFMPRETPHAWKNSGPGVGRALFMFTPGDAGKLFEELRRLQLPFMTADPAVIGPLLQRYGWEILGPDPL
jgi:mannose-6-phosphate isomerase-like protein (cupin superfamily)